MIEEYTRIPSDKAKFLRCPVPFTDADGSVHAYCDGTDCMAWMREIDDNGEPTGCGRCGMVRAIAPLYSCMWPAGCDQTASEESYE